MGNQILFLNGYPKELLKQRAKVDSSEEFQARKRALGCRFRKELESFPKEINIFYNINQYISFIKGAHGHSKQLTNPRILLKIHGYIRQNYHKKNLEMIPTDIIQIIYDYSSRNNCALSSHALFKCIVLFTNENINDVSNIIPANELERERLSDYKTILTIKDDDITYNDFIQAIYDKLKLPKFTHLQLNYYNTNNYHNFDINKFRYDSSNNPFKKYTHSIAIFYSSIPKENEYVHQIFLQGGGLKTLGPFPFVWPVKRRVQIGQGGYASTTAAMYDDQPEIIKKFLYLMGLDGENYESLISIDYRQGILGYGKRVKDRSRRVSDRKWAWHIPHVKRIYLTFNDDRPISYM